MPMKKREEASVSLNWPAHLTDHYLFTFSPDTHHSRILVTLPLTHPPPPTTHDPSLFAHYPPAHVHQRTTTNHQESMEQRSAERQKESIEMAEAAAEERQGMTMYIAASMKTRHEAGRYCASTVSLRAPTRLV